MYEANGDEKKIAQTRAEIEKRKFEYNHVAKDYFTMKPTYFNSGCCCYNDGDITGIEIEAGCLRLIKWAGKEGGPKRQILEEEKLEILLKATC
jgi:hypothetical protein